MNFTFDDVQYYYNIFELQKYGEDYLACDRRSKISYNSLFINLGTKFAHFWVNALLDSKSDKYDSVYAFNEDARKLYYSLMHIYINDLNEDNALRDDFCLQETLLDMDLNPKFIKRLISSIQRSDFMRDTLDTWARYATGDSRFYPDVKRKTTFR